MVSLLLLFVWEMAGFVALAFLEKTVEGEYAGGERTFGWRKKVFGYELKEYHFWLWFVVVPVFVFSPLVVTGIDMKVFGTLLIAYLLGGILEDFTYFVVNPKFGLKKWNSSGSSWMPWVKLGRVEVPQFYLRNTVAAVFIWFIFVAY